MLKYKNKDKGEDSRLVVGFSIEGGKMEKNGMVVTKSIARDVAITVKPCNKVCDAEVIQGEVPEDFLYKNQGYDCEIIEQELSMNPSSYRLMVLQDIKKSEWKPSKEEKEQIKELKIPPKVEKIIEKYDTDNNMRKTLIAGMMAGSPDSKTGIAALTPEKIEGKLEKPFRSESQRRFAHAHPEKFGGKKGIKEWENKTSKDIPEKVKKDEKLKKSQPPLRNKDLGLGQDARMDVKHVDRDKTYKNPKSTPEKPLPDITSGELENKKLVQMAQQGMKQGLKDPNKISSKKQKQIRAEAEKGYENILKPQEYGGTNVNIPGSQQRSFSFEKDKPEAPGVKSVFYRNRFKRPPSQQLGAELHEANHGFFTDIENKYSKDHSLALSKKMLKDHFHPEDIKNVRDFLKKSKYKAGDPYFNEEHITHISDILNSPTTRKSFYKHIGLKNAPNLLVKEKQRRINEINEAKKTLTGKDLAKKIKHIKSTPGFENITPEEMDELDRAKSISKRLKTGWKKTAEYVSNPLQLADFLNQIGEKQKKK
jgi:hypothetical protein